MITIGLAGHIDHGKSSLVRRLTGVDPDRLPEEKERGMTIDLGFAHWTPPGEETSSAEVSFVDVPGHERFVRNMIAGAGGIEAVLLVVAADDGWMPQSQEHFDIIRLLDIQRGLIAVTKIDLVEPDWLMTVIDDIRDRVAGSFLADAPIVSVSSTTGAGFGELEGCLKDLSRESSTDANSQLVNHHDIGKPRLTIDRSFVLAGIGGVVTGSVRDGSLSVGDEIALTPAGVKGKIRTLQRHERQVTTVVAGQRAALSFTGIEREELSRGVFVTTPQLGDPALNGRVLLTRLEALPNCPVKLTHRRKLLLFFGAAEIPCEMRLPGAQDLPGGESATVALRCDEAPFCFAGDRFVLRLPSPQVTIGGGLVLDWSDSLPQKDELKRRLALADKSFAEEKGNAETLLVRLLVFQLQVRFPQARDAILLRSVYSQEEIQAAIDSLLEQEEIVEHESLLFPAEPLNVWLDQLAVNVERRFSEAPHLKGLSVAEVSRLAPKAFRDIITDSSALIAMATQRNILISVTGLYRLPGRGMSVSGAVRKESERILDELQSHPFAPPLISKLVSGGKVSKEALGYLFNTEQAIKVNSELTLSAESWRDVLQRIRKRLDSGGEVTVAWLRSELDTSRKYALPILEELDNLDITERVEDNRVPGRKFVTFFEEFDRVS